ncbi:MAG: CocE/NonD family hydrolase [Candidatus Binatia bacterium]
MRPRVTALTFAGAVLVASLACGDAVAATSYTRIDAQVPVDPGVSLDASLYVPNAPPPAGGFPLIVRQHGGGSNKDNPYDTLHGIHAVETGNYALLMYSHRGHGDSGGLFDFFGPQSVADFSKLLDWVAATSRVHGLGIDTQNVGTNGYSQGGGLSLLPAAFDSRVKVVAVGNTFDSLSHALKPDGCYKLSWSTGVFAAAYKAAGARTDDLTALRWGLALATDTEDVSTPLGPSASQELAAHSPLTYVHRLAAPFSDPHGSRSSVPVFWSNSWEDQLFPADHPESILEALDDAGVATHYWFASGGHAAGPDDPADVAAKEAAMLAWFDFHLRGVGTLPAARVDYAERLPSGGWTHKTAADWPVPEAVARGLHPRADGTLAESADSATAVGQVVNDLANLNVENDAILNEIAGNFPGGRDVLQSVPESGTPLDTRLYVSPVRETAAEIVGAPELRLAIRSTAVNRFQVSAKVFDVATDGTARMINRGCVSLPAGTTEATLRLWPNAYVFAAGHRIALAISAVDFPVFAPDEEPQATTILSGTELSLPTIP